MHLIQEVVRHDSEFLNQDSSIENMTSTEKETESLKGTMNHKSDESITSSASSFSPPSLDESEMKAIAEATAAADANYVPSQTLLSSNSPYPLIRSVDGLSLKRFNPNPSKFCAKDVIIPLRGKLNVPVHVTTSGSIVDYIIKSKDFDIGFGVTAEREEGITVVKVSMNVSCFE